MKYSILMPYIDRIPQLRTTLDSFMMHGYDKRTDLEIIIVEDIKNFNNSKAHQNLHDLLWRYSALSITTILAGSKDCWNPGMAFNAASAWAKGEYLILTNPECAHQANVLQGLDRFFNEFPDSYAVCSCLSVLSEGMTMDELKNAKGKWYQHSQVRNALVHFCAALKRDAYFRIDGFDENYKHGVCFEDDDFRNRVIHAGIEIAALDSLVTVHLDHYKTKVPDYLKRHKVNKMYYEAVWGTKAFTAECVRVEVYHESEVPPDR